MLVLNALTLQVGAVLGSPHPKEAKTQGSIAYPSAVIWARSFEGGGLQRPESKVLMPLDLVLHVIITEGN